MKNSFNLHHIEWTDEQIRNFWNSVYSLGTTGFADKNANAILNIVKKKIKMNGHIIDYGAGNGNIAKILCEKFIKSKIYCSENSDEAVRLLIKNLSKYNNFSGAYLTNHDFQEKFDIVFIFEVIEHLNDEQIKTTFNNINSMLKKGGKLVISVPNSEKLNKVLCPECGAIFHPVQHQKSFNTDILIETCKEYGFEKYYLKRTYLNHQLSMKNLIKKIYFVFNKKNCPNLIGIFKKS